MKKYIKFIVLGVIIIAILLISGLFLVDYQHQEDVRTAKVNYEIASINLIKSGIDVYVAYEGKYPYDLKKLTSKIKEIELKEKKIDGMDIAIEKAIKNIPTLKYSVRGDEKAYKLTYKNSREEIKTVEANYEKDFQDR